MIHLQWETTSSPERDVASPAGDAVSPEGDLLASPNFGICDTTPLEANAFNDIFEAFMIINSPDRYNLYCKSMEFRSNSKFPERLARRATHM
jgi:hypothetical protein